MMQMDFPIKNNRRFMKHYFLNFSFVLCLFSVLFISCKKESFNANNTPAGLDLVSAKIELPQSQNQQHATITYPFSFQSTGPFTISPVSPTVVRIDQEMIITSASPFLLTNGFVRGYDDLTIPTFPDRFFNGTLSVAGQGNDSLFALVTVQTSVFSDPIDPSNGDFTGSEDFTGTFQITGGTGRYLNATGRGEYTAHSEWRPPTKVGTLFSGSTTVSATGTISVLARNGNLERLSH